MTQESDSVSCTQPQAPFVLFALALVSLYFRNLAKIVIRDREVSLPLKIVSLRHENFSKDTHGWVLTNQRSLRRDADAVQRLLPGRDRGCCEKKYANPEEKKKTNNVNKENVIDVML